MLGIFSEYAEQGNYWYIGSVKNCNLSLPYFPRVSKATRHIELYSFSILLCIYALAPSSVAPDVGNRPTVSNRGTLLPYFRDR